ncbi:MAG: hypothetical protein CBB71_07160 [Rhodopirellula sp. TMED11]|nr:MAG: hypothetical protein CBB71_07160 [Rhodopirellula sp. TMED11]
MLDVVCGLLFDAGRRSWQLRRGGGVSRVQAPCHRDSPITHWVAVNRFSLAGASERPAVGRNGLLIACLCLSLKGIVSMLESQKVAGRPEVTEAASSLTGGVELAADAGTNETPQSGARRGRRKAPVPAGADLSLDPVPCVGTFDERCRKVVEVASMAFTCTGSWVAFYREILGVEGIVVQLFPAELERRRFFGTPQFIAVQEMLAGMRSEDTSKSDAAEPEQMITIRIPRSLHLSLQAESAECNLSINKLAISKLLVPADPRFVPEQVGNIRGRKPGEQGKAAKQGLVMQAKVKANATGQPNLG